MITIPPLRERGDDVVMLADEFLETLREIPPAHLAMLTPAAFAALSDDDKKEVLRKATALGYQSESVMDDEATGLAKRILGKDGVKDLFDTARSRAEDDSDAYDRVRIGKPTISEVESILSGGQAIAYKIIAHINWKPADIDILVDRMVDTKGATFDEDYR